MLFRPKRIVHATTEQEIDSALATADQVIVEGDDQLLSYAVGKASADPQNKITVETGEVTTTITPTTEVAASAKRFPWVIDNADMKPLSASVEQPRRVHPLVVAIVSIVSLVVVGVVVGVLWQTAAPKSSPTASTGPPQQQQPQQQQQSPAPPPPTPSIGPVTSAPPPSDYTLTLVQTLVWPMVTIVSIIALFLIAWKAIVGGRNVEITWKVTEKVQGKVVISKQRAAAKPRRAVA